MNEFRQRLARFNRDCLVAGVDQFAGVSGCLRRDDADFGQLAETAIGWRPRQTIRHQQRGDRYLRTLLIHARAAQSSALV